MAENEFGAGKPVEEAAEHQPQGVGAGLESPFPGGAPQPGVSVQGAGRRHRIGRVDVDRSSQCLRSIPERLQRWMVEILAVGVAVDHGAAEFQLALATLELIRGGSRVLHGKVREAVVAVRPLLDFACQEVVGVARLAARNLGVRLDLDARTGQGQDRTRDARAIHCREP